MTLRFLTLLCITAMGFAAVADEPAIVTRIKHGGNIKISAPAGLAERDNSELRSKETSGDKSDEDKTDSREENNNPKIPTRQTVQSRGMGFRIQVCTAATKQEAQQRAVQVATKFPHYRTYVTFKSPTWRLRVGDFKNHGSAQDAIKSLRATFPNYAQQMSVVRDKINNWTND